jgi:DNA-binding MarR family transcriptional regulator
MPGTHHTGAAATCQQPAAAAVDRRLIARYGAAALDDGYTAIPCVVIRHRRALGITSAEWDYICELWSYWHSIEGPYPGVATLAAGLGVDQSTIRRHRASLEQKGLLRVTLDGAHNRYDLTPLIDAAVGQERLQHVQRTAAPGPRIVAHPERAELHAEQEVEKKSALDSMPPTPTAAREIPLHAEASNERLGQEGGGRQSTVSPHEGVIPEDRTLTQVIQDLSAELGDDAPVSSLSRAHNLWRGTGIPLPRFLQLVDTAAARTRARQDRIIKRRREAAGAPNGMPYFFAVLGDLLRPAPAEVGPDRRRTGPVERRRRRESGREEPVNSWDAWTGRPERPTIAETNEVWRAALQELALVLTVENFNTWLAPTRVLAQDGDLLRVAVPCQFNKDWLEAKLHGRVMNALARVGHEGMRVEYVVEASA